MPSACEYASSRSSRAQSRTRLRIALPRSDVSQQRSISSTSSQRPALWKPSAGPVGRLRERVLELVAVVEDRLRRDDLLERRLVDPAEAAQRVLDLALLLLELRLVREILEAAAAAGGVVRARRLDALRARREDVDRERLRVVPLHLRHACAHAVAGKAAADEDDVAVQPRDAVPAVREGLDVELDDVVTPDAATFVVALFKPLDDRVRDRAAKRIEKQFAHDPSVTLGGGVIGYEQVGRTVEDDLLRAETIAFPLLIPSRSGFSAGSSRRCCRRSSAR